MKKGVRFDLPNEDARAANAIPRYNTSAYSSSGGPLHVSYPNSANPAASWRSLGLNPIGLREIPGMEDGNLLGWTWIAQTIDPATQVRSTSELSFLREALQLNDNLIVYQRTLAKKILFRSNKGASGVMVKASGIESEKVSYTISAIREVIISSGSFRLLQMLMVSGTGPAATF